jgi:DNA-binding NarL/FixJ family response regulator
MKLLIMDDHAGTHGRLLAMLGSVASQDELSIAHSLREIVEIAATRLLDAAVLDMNLPDGDGLEALRAIKYLSPATRVFMFSNLIDYRASAMRAGAEAFYDKSLEFEAMVDRLVSLHCPPSRPLSQ